MACGSFTSRKYTRKWAFQARIRTIRRISGSGVPLWGRSWPQIGSGPQTLLRSQRRTRKSLHADRIRALSAPCRANFRLDRLRAGHERPPSSTSYISTTPDHKRACPPASRPPPTPPWPPDHPPAHPPRAAARVRNCIIVPALKSFRPSATRIRRSHAPLAYAARALPPCRSHAAHFRATEMPVVYLFWLSSGEVRPTTCGPANRLPSWPEWTQFGPMAAKFGNFPVPARIRQM